MYPQSVQIYRYLNIHRQFTPCKYKVTPDVIIDGVPVLSNDIACIVISVDCLSTITQDFYKIR
jgi:hypothetical protein